jgi:cytochrome b561
MESSDRYHWFAVALHWVIAQLMIINFLLGLGHESFPESQQRIAIDLHKSIGIFALGLIVMRVLWRMTHRPPELPVGFKSWEKSLSGFVHGMFTS